MPAAHRYEDDTLSERERPPEAALHSLEEEIDAETAAFRQALAVGDAVEACDGKSQWWPATIDGKYLAPGTPSGSIVSVRVADGFGTIWSSVPLTHVRPSASPAVRGEAQAPEVEQGVDPAAEAALAEAARAAFEVRGCGLASFDGEYVAAGRADDRPRYVRRGSTRPMCTHRGDVWVLTLDGSEPWYFAPGNGQVPPTTTWLCCKGHAPAPTLRLLDAEPPPEAPEGEAVDVCPGAHVRLAGAGSAASNGVYASLPAAEGRFVFKQNGGRAVIVWHESVGKAPAAWYLAGPEALYVRPWPSWRTLPRTGWRPYELFPGVPGEPPGPTLAPLSQSATTACEDGEHVAWRPVVRCSAPDALAREAPGVQHGEDVALDVMYCNTRI